MSLLHERLQEAVIARQTARNSTDFVRARAREKLLRRRLEEAGEQVNHAVTLPPKLEMLLDRLKGAKVNVPLDIHHIAVTKLSDGRYVATLGQGTLSTSDPELLAHAIASYLHHHHHLKERGEHALFGLSPQAAQSFARTWSQRADGGTAAERQQAYNEVYSKDPLGYVRQTFSQDMDPQTLLDAEQALISAKQSAGNA